MQNTPVTSPPENNLGRIKRVSHRYKLLFSALLLFIPLMDCLMWLFFNHIPASFTQAPVQLMQALPLAVRFQALAISLIPLSVVLAACYQLRQLFSMYEKGRIFDHNSIRQIRTLGILILAWVLSNMIYLPLITVCLSMTNPPGQRFISIGFSPGDIATLITGAIVILISWVLNEGRKLEADLAHTI